MTKDADKTPRPSADYEVGYGKPPKHAQFNPGQSGNPKGRPKGSKSLIGHVQDQLNQRITIREKGQSRTVTVREAIAMRMMEAALKGDLKTITQVLALDARQADPVQNAGATALSPAEQQMLEELTDGALNTCPVSDKDVATEAKPETC